MKSQNNRAYVLGSARIPFVKSQTAYAEFSRKDLLVGALNGLVKQYHLEGKLMDDSAVGAVMNGPADFNLTREAILSTSLDPHSPGYNVQRACGTGLETAWQIAMKTHSGSIDVGIAGGIDTNSDVPIEISKHMKKFLMDLGRAKSFGQKLTALGQLSFKSFKPAIPSVNEPRTLKSMGEHCEMMVQEWKISREEQDEIAFASHQNGAKAYADGFYDDLVHPFGGIQRDGTLRADTTLEKLARLKPVFDLTGKGTLTAGNSSPLTDGAACVLIGNEAGAARLSLKPLAEIIDVQVAAVNFVKGEGLLMAPTRAVSQLLERHKLTFQDFDYFEIHEAFAGQVLCNLKAWESADYCRNVLGRNSPIGPIDRKRMNVVGSSLALGHPFAATGARILGTVAKLLATTGKKRGLISICTAGGMGIAAIVESV